MSSASPEKTIMVSFVKASKGITPSRNYRLVVEDGSVIGFEAKVVDSLPEKGESQYIYLVKKTIQAEGDAYDEYMWVLLPNGQYGWEHVGVTGEVSVKLYDDEGQNTDGAMHQKAVTDALQKLGDMIQEVDVEVPGEYTDEEWANLWK